MAWELITIIDGVSTVKTLPEAGTFVLGRGEDANVVIDHASVSRRHVRLVIGESGITIEDLGSANGSRLVSTVSGALHTAQTSDIRLEPHEPVAVSANGSIHLGSVVVLVRPIAIAPAPKAGGMIAASPAMRHVLDLVERIAPSPLSVLLVGETGVGKDVVARALHAASPRKDGPFVAINCAALAEHLVESELFGHERGAFTGANTSKAGLLEEATGGTAFLDEIGELPMPQQSKLLRALEEHAVMRVGATKTRPIDVRFVAATNRDPAKEAEGGTFRRDLYFRLSGMTIAIPPLRERSEDLAPLLDAFARRAAVTLGRTAPTFSAEAMDLLRAYPFPGNVRELKNVVERGVALSAGGVIGKEHLVLSPVVTTAPPAAPAGDERQRIVDALAQCGGNQTRAAALLGISRRTLVTRLGEYGIARPLRPRSHDD